MWGGGKVNREIGPGAQVKARVKVQDQQCGSAKNASGKSSSQQVFSPRFALYFFLFSSVAKF